MRNDFTNVYKFTQLYSRAKKLSKISKIIKNIENNKNNKIVVNTNMKIKLQKQKYLIALFLFMINLLFSSTFLIYEKDWYVYLFVLALASILNTFSVFLIVGHKMITNDKELPRLESKNYVYVVPCYNESEQELTASLNSLTLQRVVKNDKRSLLIIQDGHNSAGPILKTILNIQDDNLGEYYDYKTWDNNRNIIRIFNGQYTHLTETIDYILILKNKNMGKRDSLFLARTLFYSYNTHIEDDEVEFSVSDGLLKYMTGLYTDIYGGIAIDYCIGIDADTIFDYNCSYELIQSIEKNANIHGSVGYVDILQSDKTKTSMYSPFHLYQYGEYMFSQCLRRLTQSTITKKVNCLSGCNQIIRISKETCGNAILNVFNYLPEEKENIFNHIRSYASEDRNHICHMLSMYPYVQSTQTLKAIAYTSVPTSISVFMSQRRRWNLGAMTNDMLLVYLSGINIFERISAFVNITTYCLSPFIFIATIAFIKAIIVYPSMLMLYLSTLILIPLLYAFTIPIFIRPLSFRDSMYYYVSYLFYLTTASLVNLLTYGYSISQMDNLTWGKTRELKPMELEYHVEPIEQVELSNNELQKDEYISIKTNDVDVYGKLNVSSNTNTSTINSTSSITNSVNYIIIDAYNNNENNNQSSINDGDNNNNSNNSPDTMSCFDMMYSDI